MGNKGLETTRGDAGPSQSEEKIEMTHQELGLQLRQIFPQLVHDPDTRDMNHEVLARYFIKVYPDYLDLVAPAASAIYDATTSPVEVERGMFTTEGTHQDNIGKAIANRQSYVNMVYDGEQKIEAIMRSLPVTALHDIAIETHKTNQAIRLETAKTDETIRLEESRIAQGLDAGNRDLLTPHELIEILEAKLETTIKRRDRETHPEIRADLTESIAHQRGVLRARRQQAMVQVTDRKRLGDGNQDHDRPAGRGEEAEEDLE